MGITRIPKDVYDRFNERFGIIDRMGVNVWGVGETWLMIAEATERHGMTADRDLVDEVAGELVAEGRDPQQLCIMILAGEDIREEAGIPDEFEGYPVYLFVAGRPEAL